MANTTALITGACGFLGSHLTQSFLREGWSVWAVDNFATGSRLNLEYLRALPGADERLRFVEADVTAPWESWAQRPTGQVAQVFHFASPASPPHYQRLGLETMWVNSIGLDRALRFADAHGGRLTFASTSEIYGDPEVTPQPESYRGRVNTVGPRACYDEAKRFGEALIYTHNLKHSTKHGIVRIFNTYGPRMNPRDGRVVINLLAQALRREPLTIYGDGSQTRSFCYVDDLVRAIRAFATSGELGPINIGNDEEFTILQLAQEVRALFADRSLEVVHRELPADDPVRRRPQLDLARTRLNYAPRVRLAEGLAQMRKWLETVSLDQH